MEFRGASLAKGRQIRLLKYSRSKVNGLGQTTMLAIKMEEVVGFKSSGGRASLVMQWLRVHLPMQGTRV